MKIKGKKIKQGVRNIFKKLFQKIYLIFVLLVILNLILGEFFFWKYYLKAEEKEIEIPSSLKIDQTLLNKFSLNQREREELFKAALNKDYPELFSSSALRKTEIEK